MKARFTSSPISRRSFIGKLSGAAALAIAPRSVRAFDTPPPARKLGVALLGLGSYATHQLAPALQMTKHCRLAGVVTGDRAKGNRWARQFGFPEKNVYGYETIGQIADNPDIDIVYVVTPNGLHAEYTIAAARAGKHVISEKPMANSVADCDAMIDACRKANVRLAVGYRLHYEPHNAELMRLARDRDFGPFMRMDGENGFEMSSDSTPESVWRLNKKLAGGGPLMDMGIYVIQAACMAKVEAVPIAVNAKFGRVTRPRVFSEVEESIMWTMEYADGAKAGCLATYAESVSKFRAKAKNGWAQLEYPAFYYSEPHLNTSRGPVRRPNVNHQAAQLDGMALEILENRPTLAPGSMGRRDLAIIEAIYASANSGQRVEVRA